MIIGIPGEIKEDENRVSITPAGVHALRERGHPVLVQKNAGHGSGIEDVEYDKEGAEIIETGREIYERSEMIMKVKEPLKHEIELLREGQILYTYLHLAPDREQLTGLLSRKVTGIAYETIEVEGKLVLLEPMSEVAGKIAGIMGSYYLARPYGGRGMLPGGVAGVHSATFVILGGGTAGINAAKIASGLGAKVIVMDIDLERMRYLEDILPMNCEMIMSNRINVEMEVTKADVVIGTVLIPGAKTPRLLSQEIVASMKKGSVIVDVSIDQGGCAETSRPTTHSDPVYTENGVVHYCVANMPGAFPRTSTFALTNATLPFALEIADKGWMKASRTNEAIKKGVNVHGGLIAYPSVAEAHAMDFTPVDDMIV